ncbi:penicillin acylase family protein [Sinisalibacter aestuarii]|uniref:Penicillin acylase n=1 Tax=Sinisalibacter aestuarii TaxID=2949426 RepID=A0ABQ5LWK2_9RHOB|nr:penicillin acylase family protein [Sinisalibacter aestuarii]GKY88998.1 penicillin acylase [Sinisalibacter aestuarii]
MAGVFRWTVRVVTAVLVLAVAAFGFAYYLASRSLPDYDVTRPARGITAPVEIVRDHANVPHIFGETDEDVFFGLGYAHAQDRLWQMIMLRRTAQGRLSEIFGARTLAVDELMRRLDLYALAQQAVAYQSDETRAALTAYAHGVNAWLDRVNDEALGRGAPELFLFDNDISPWVPADSLAVLKLMAVQMGGHIQEEVLRARVALALDTDRLHDILPDAPGTGVAALPEYAALFGLEKTDFAALAPLSGGDPLSPVAAPGMAGASNAWAAAPSRSAAGGTLLANDPHLGFTAPTIWYLARLELQSGGIIGGTIPGMPVLLLGRSESFGWGLTSSYMDDQDVFIEKLNPDAPGEVLTPDGYRPMEARASIIRVKDAAPVTIELRWTENGPVLPGSHYGLAAVTPPGHVAAIGWTMLSARDRSMTSAMRLMQAKSVAEGIAAGADFLAPSQNVTMVDGEHIALKTVGAMPRRAADHMTLGRMPAPGWEAQNRWLGFEAYEANPEFSDPAGGIVGNTNNKIVERPFPLHVSWDWGDTQRVQRWQRLMQAREVHTRESFIEAQLDPVSITARNLLPLVGADLWFTGEAAPDGTPERARQRALQLLADWNGEMNEHMPEPLIYMAWMRALQDRLIRDELGPLANAFTHVEPVFIERVFRDVDGAGAWCDVVQSAPEESCTEIARIALDEALIWIGENVGGETEALRWGDVHQATHDHAVLGGVPFLKWFVNIHQSTSGSDNTLNRGRTIGTGPNPFLNVHGAGYRGVYDFADPDSSLFITATGQSGHFLSRHYDDLGELWRRGEYIPMSLDEGLARAAAEGVTTLVPMQ